MTRAAPLLWLASFLAAPALRAGEPPEEPTPAAQAVAQLEQHLAALLDEGTDLEHRTPYESLLNDAARVARDYPDEPAAARAYLVIARCHEVLGNHPEKEAAFQRYVDVLAGRSQDHAAEALRREAEALVARRELYVAVKVLQSMLARFPEGPQATYALYRLGTCYLWMDDYEEAAEAFAEVLERWPDSELALQACLRMARCNFLRGQPGQSIPLLEGYLESHPEGPRRAALLFDLGVAHYVSRDYYAALVQFQELVQKAPESPYAEVARACVAKLRAEVLERLTP
ncbi:MAG: tetratricopeptide repeat protein [Candidatus Brocadiia bacterium]